MMFFPPRLTLRARAVMVFAVCLIALGALPPRATEAARTRSTLDDTVSEFSRGTFQRSSLGTLRNTAASPKDLAGAVQLGPIGLLKQWIDSPFTLPKRLIRMGATAIGNRVYVVGGLTPVGSATQSVADVWSAAVSQSTGAFLESWQAEPALPAVKGSNQTGFTNPVAEVNSPAVVSFAKPGGGYIYVIGGNTRPSVTSTFEFSSYAVRIGTVNAAGRITGWVAGPPLPSPDPNDTLGLLQLGAQSSIAQTLTVNGVTYVYVIGGLKRYREGAGGQARTTSEGSKNVFYARVNPSSGQLLKPSTGQPGWDKLFDIPIPGDSPAGIWDAVGFADHFTVSTGDSQDMLYVVGGQITPDLTNENPPVLPTFSETAYRAFVAGDGKLTWDFTWRGVLPETRNGLSGVSFNGSLYVVGGMPSGQNEPDKGVLTSYVEDNMQLHQFNEVPPGVLGGGSNFLKSADALRFPRVFHATAVVPGDDTTATEGFIYVFGGRGDTRDANTGDDNGSDSVFYGKIGDSEDVATTGYASDAWYFSKPYEINYTGAQLQKMFWSAQIDRSVADNDILLDYRVSSANSCSNPGWSDADWKPLDAVESDATHRTRNGENTSPAINLAARCLQYRARLTTASYRVTPSLLNISIEIVIPGNPDLRPIRVNALRGSGNALTGLTVTIDNVNQISPPTLAADFDSGGSFFVDLCIFKPGQTPVRPTIPMSDNNHQCSKAYADINKSLMGANTTYTITRWYDTAEEKPLNILSLFPDPGRYNVIVVVDSYNYIDEGTAGGEGNNISNTTPIDVPRVANIVRTPLIRRP